MNETTLTVTSNDNVYSIVDRGNGPSIILYPSLGRAGSDFDDLARSLSENGYRTVAVTPPGFETPLGNPRWETLFDIGGELWDIADQLGIENTVVLGHAFGNRVARTFSTIRPSSVSALILLACGGEIHASNQVTEVFMRIFDSSRSESERENDVKEVFFAPANEVEEWRDGWNGELALLQGGAVRATDHAAFYLGGTAPGLVLQGLDDVIASPQNSKNLVAKRPNTKLIDLENCGHAMLPEQPVRIKEELLAFLSAQKLK